MSMIHRRTPQGGFTLIELVVVIVILGILAAFAIPRFANIATDARVSSLRGLTGTLRSTSALVHGLALARNETGATGDVDLDATTNVDVVYGYPAGTADGIFAALAQLDNFTVTYAGGVATFTVNGATTPASCSVTYTQPTGPGVLGVVGTPVETGC